MWRSNAFYFTGKLTLHSRRTHWEALTYVSGPLQVGWCSPSCRGLFYSSTFTIFQNFFCSSNFLLIPQPPPQSQLLTVLSPPVPVLLFSLMVQYPSSSSTRTTLDPAHDPPPWFSPPAPPFHRAVSLPFPLFLAQHSPSILPLPLTGSLMPKVSKMFAPLQPLLTPSTLESFGPLLYDNNGGWPLKGSLLPLPYLPLFPRGIKWTKTYNGVGHVARSNLELQV